MTLAQYKAQTEPVKMPDIILNEGEYRIIETLDKGTPNEISAVLVDQFNYTYAMKGGDNRLYVMDEHGNTKATSCFRIA